MTFHDHIKGLPSDELIKLAEDMRANLMKTFAAFAKPVFEKLANEQQAVVAPEKNVQGESNEYDRLYKQNGVDHAALKGAIKEALYTNDVQSLGLIVKSLQEKFGDELATNAINIARTIMQEALAKGELAPENVASFTKAFEMMDAAADATATTQN